MPVTDFKIKEKYRYQAGFSSYLESESVAGALPLGQNSPQKPPLGLYAEKLSGTSFTAPRHENKQTWLYRILPSCAHPPFSRQQDTIENKKEEVKENDKKEEIESLKSLLPQLDSRSMHYVPNQLRWNPFDFPAVGTDFVSGLRPLAGAGDPKTKDGIAVYAYVATSSMPAREAFYSADGDLLVVPQQGALDVRTELGHLLLRPGEIGILPRGIKYRVDLFSEEARGYALELYHGHFQLPELGPIGSNGLANARDFLAPVAHFDSPSRSRSSSDKWIILVKFANTLHATAQPHSPFDVVAWHGSYYPCKYDLGRFNTIGSISYDHPDPSIFTVLTATGSGRHGAGTALADFVVFPSRWLVGEDTFRPPWFHRNTMAEFMGLISGEYDAKKGGKGGFVPGGASLHNVMAGHGPDDGTVEVARNADLKPQKIGAGGMAFMFETCLMLGVTEWGLKTCQKVQGTYSESSWGGLKVYWEGTEGKKIRSHLL